MHRERADCPKFTWRTLFVSRRHTNTYDAHVIIEHVRQLDTFILSGTRSDKNRKQTLPRVANDNYVEE